VKHEGKRSILIVEDDEDVRGALAAVLEEEGYSVLEARHGEEALRTLRGPDTVCLILLDLFMPTMNGWAFRDEQRRDPELAAIPVIVLSADGAALKSAGSMGVVDYMVKPVDFDRLLKLVALHC
jgi:CheY-like chemotaxis protein